MCSAGWSNSVCMIMFSFEGGTSRESEAKRSEDREDEGYEGLYGQTWRPATRNSTEGDKSNNIYAHIYTYNIDTL